MLKARKEQGNLKTVGCLEWRSKEVYFWNTKVNINLYCFEVTNDGVNKRTFYDLRFFFPRVLGEYTGFCTYFYTFFSNTKILYLYWIEITIFDGSSIASRHMAHCMCAFIDYAPRVLSTVSDEGKVPSLIWILNLWSKTVFNRFFKRFFLSLSCMLILIHLA